MTLEDFVDHLTAALPQVVVHADEGELERDQPYYALARAVDWLGDEVLEGTEATGLRVRAGREDDMRAFWAFVERAAAHRDPDIDNLLAIELFEGIWWTEDVHDWLGPHTRTLLRNAQVWLEPYNSTVGRRPKR